MGILASVSDHGREESSAPKVRLGRLAFVIVGVAIAAVIIDAAARSWTIDRPSVVQVVICVALLAAGAIWFWTWCAIEGVRMGTGGRVAGNVTIRDAAQREKLVRRQTIAQRRSIVFRHFMPLAIASMLVGFTVLLL